MNFSKAFDLVPHSSNVNEVIRAVLNSFFFFYEKISHAPKAPKYKDATKQKHKTLQANKNKKCTYKTSKGKKVTYSLICVFVLFVRAKKRKQNKVKSLRNVNVLNTDVPTTRFI